MGRFRELKVWQKAVDVAVEVYQLTKEGAISRDFGLIDQMRRSAVSVPSNIAEGDELNTDKQAINHFYHSRGSSGELITQLIISERVGYIEKETSEKLIEKCSEVSRMVNGLIKHRSK